MNIKDYPLVLKAEHVAEIMNISLRSAYNYMSYTDFPSFRMPGKRGAVRVMRDTFYAWMLEKSEGKGA